MHVRAGGVIALAMGIVFLGGEAGAQSHRTNRYAEPPAGQGTWSPPREWDGPYTSPYVYERRYIREGVPGRSYDDAYPRAEYGGASDRTSFSDIFGRRPLRPEERPSAAIPSGDAGGSPATHTVEQMPLPAIVAPEQDLRSDGRFSEPIGSVPSEGRFGAPGRFGAAPSTEPLGVARPPMTVMPDRPATFASLPPEDQPEDGEPKELPPNLKRQLVDYATKEPAGTIVIDTQNTYLYYVLGGGKAMRYGIGVGRDGFTWAGRERVSRMTEWPDWYPPADMIERQPYLPRMMAGGPGNPLGARALYLGKTLYRIHGTNQPSTIGKFVSSGCIRMLNDDVVDLFGRVQVGTRVAVLPGSAPKSASSEVPGSGAGDPTPIAAAPAANGAPPASGPALR